MKPVDERAQREAYLLLKVARLERALDYAEASWGKAPFVRIRFEMNR